MKVEYGARASLDGTSDSAVVGHLDRFQSGFELLGKVNQRRWVGLQHNRSRFYNAQGASPNQWAME